MSTLPLNTPASAWLQSLRLRTLPLAFASILVGSSLASFQGSMKFSVALLALLTAGLLQVLSNLANDYGDAVKGSDTPARLGPMRGMQKGLITRHQMKRAIKLCVFAAVMSGLALITVACQKPADILVFLLLGLLSIAAAITYTVGTRPYGYRGLGDVSVLLFFGWVSVAGTYYLQVGEIDVLVLLPATACGMLAAAVLNINNLRDIESDAEHGKNTLAVRLGPKMARYYQLFLLLGAIVCLTLFSALYFPGWRGFLFLLAAPMLANHGKKVLHSTAPEQVRPLLEHMVKAALLTQVLFALGLFLN